MGIIEQSLPEMHAEYAWRDGDWLVLHEKKAMLPQRCVLCDAPVDGKPTKVFWQETSSLMDGCGLFLFGPIAVVLAGLLAPRATLRLWFCAEHGAKKRRRSRRIFWPILLLGIALFVMGFMGVMTWSGPDVPDSTWTIVFIIGALMMFLGGSLSVVALLVIASPPRLIRAKKIDKPFVWLDMVSPEYLARFPEVPAQR